MRIVMICAMLAAALVPRTTGAQTLPLTESEALAWLLPGSPRVRAIRSTIDVARADLAAASRWPNPRLNVDRESVAGTTEYLATVGQMLPISGQRGLQIRAASALVDASSWRADDELRRTRADLRLAFGELLAAQRREAALTATRDRLRSVVDVLTTREAAGDTAGFDRLRAERELLDVDADRAIAAGQRARAQALLAGFFGEPIDPSRIIAMRDPAEPSGLPPAGVLVERAESTRGDLLALREEAEAARLSARAANRRRIPDLEFVAGTKTSSVAGGQIGGIFGVQAAIPIFDRGRAERTLAEAVGDQAAVRAAAFRLVLRAQIAGLHAEVLGRRDTAARYLAGAVEHTDEIERIARLSYDAGERSILELLDAYRMGAAARLRQVALDAAVRQAEIELEFVSGWEIP